MGPLSLLFTSLKRSNLFSYGLLATYLYCELTQYAILQFLGLGPHRTTMLVPVSDRDKIKRVAPRFQWPLKSEEVGFLKYFLPIFISIYYLPCVVNFAGVRFLTEGTSSPTYFPLRAQVAFRRFHTTCKLIM